MRIHVDLWFIWEVDGWIDGLLIHVGCPILYIYSWSWWWLLVNVLYITTSIHMDPLGMDIGWFFSLNSSGWNRELDSKDSCETFLCMTTPKRYSEFRFFRVKCSKTSLDFEHNTAQTQTSKVHPKFQRKKKASIFAKGHPTANLVAPLGRLKVSINPLWRSSRTWGNTVAVYLHVFATLGCPTTHLSFRLRSYRCHIPTHSA